MPMDQATRIKIFLKDLQDLFHDHIIGQETEATHQMLEEILKESIQLALIKSAFNA